MNLPTFLFRDTDVPEVDIIILEPPSPYQKCRRMGSATFCTMYYGVAGLSTESQPRTKGLDRKVLFHRLTLTDLVVD